ncbi:MAG: hypothetical protein Kow0031_25870 [Anaerolineae bacterium]
MTKTEHWQQQLTDSRQALLETLNGLDAGQWATPVYGEGQDWTVQDVVSHLVDSEAGMSIHIHKIRKGRETVPADFDLNQWNAGVRQRTGPASPQELLQRLDANRARLLEGLASLTDDEWSLTGRHPLRGVITIEQYFETITEHERLHTGHIRQAVAL